MFTLTQLCLITLVQTCTSKDKKNKVKICYECYPDLTKSIINVFPNWIEATRALLLPYPFYHKAVIHQPFPGYKKLSTPKTSKFISKLFTIQLTKYGFQYHHSLSNIICKTPQNTEVTVSIIKEFLNINEAKKYAKKKGWLLISEISYCIKRIK